MCLFNGVNFFSIETIDAKLKIISAIFPDLSNINTNAALLSSTFDKNLEHRLLMWKEDAREFKFSSKFHYLANVLKVLK